MQVIITPSLPADLDALTRLWEVSVRTTHHFLSEEDIRFLKPLVRNDYLPAVELYVVRNVENAVAAFIGLSEDAVEMLFVHPAEQGKGYGTALLNFAVREKRRFKIDVNEQNEKAYRFYLNKGFRVVGRDAVDPQGRPFPILHLEWRDE